MRPLALGLLLGSALAASYLGLPGADTGRPALDRSYALVYRAENPRAVLLLVRGLLGGSTNFALLAEHLRREAPWLEVWAWERRANGLEDRRGFLGEDPLAYYQALPEPDLSPLRDFGLEVHLKDLDLAVAEASKRAPVVLAGHSLGASLATLYAWAHGEKLLGLVLLDGTLGLVTLSREAFLRGQETPLGPLPGLEDLLSGRASPVFRLPGLSPRDLALAEAEAFLAGKRPEEPVPFGPYRATREAKALLRVDDHYSPFPLFSVSAGRAWAREGLSLLGLLQGRLTLTVRGPRAGPIRWRDTGEATDPRAFLKAFAREETGFSEWYFPYRLLLEVAGYPYVRPDLKPRPLPYPVLALGAGRGLVDRPEAFRLPELFPETPSKAQVLPGLTHLDLLTEREGRTARALRDYLELLLGPSRPGPAGPP
ncbi:MULTISPECIES: alpha/beta fold hydrolase [Thermus]|jgi:pimeloyl-ACP methyl ester carboxylesterase|uniref:Alpha/beta hydrolase family protein n=1 Tax=Thermus brockianus TaxID=56956 RepID=A0A1J0LVT0_THEBO|nr:alpha/beta fold hydrolase [Thermus brockianus]APD10304.1 Alpha/beta hydrolase family protein [Thermus brockianus]